MLTPQAIDVIEAALSAKRDALAERIEHWEYIRDVVDGMGRAEKEAYDKVISEATLIDAALAELKIAKAVMQYADYPLDEETALRTERQGTQGLDFPDSVGTWAFEGICVSCPNEPVRWVRELLVWKDLGNGLVKMDWEGWDDGPQLNHMSYFTDIIRGKFYRVYMPWEVNNVQP